MRRHCNGEGILTSRLLYVGLVCSSLHESWIWKLTQMTRPTQAVRTRLAPFSRKEHELIHASVQTVWLSSSSSQSPRWSAQSYAALYLWSFRKSSKRGRSTALPTRTTPSPKKPAPRTPPKPRREGSKNWENSGRTWGTSRWNRKAR